MPPPPGPARRPPRRRASCSSTRTVSASSGPRAARRSRSAGRARSAVPLDPADRPGGRLSLSRHRSSPPIPIAARQGPDRPRGAVQGSRPRRARRQRQAEHRARARHPARQAGSAHPQPGDRHLRLRRYALRPQHRRARRARHGAEQDACEPRRTDRRQLRHRPAEGEVQRNDPKDGINYREEVFTESVRREARNPGHRLGRHRRADPRGGAGAGRRAVRHPAHEGHPGAPRRDRGRGRRGGREPRLRRRPRAGRVAPLDRGEPGRRARSWCRCRASPPFSRRRSRRRVASRRRAWSPIVPC